MAKNKYENLRVPLEKSSTDVIIPVDPDLMIREELIGPHAVNYAVQHNSSARSYMYTAHQSQSVTLIDGDIPIVQTGSDKQLSKHTFGPMAEDDCVVLRVVQRYGGISDNYVHEITEKTYFTLKQELDENNRIVKTLDIINVPLFHSGYHQNFGFSYVQDKEFLDSIKRGTKLPAGTRLAISPSVRDHGGYALGVNANMILCTHPDIAEDGVIISESLSKKMRYDVFETKAIEFGSQYLPLNLYGDENEYKPFPEIGEQINSDSVLMALRNFKDFGANKSGLDEDPLDFSPALLSADDLRKFDPIMDKCYYVRGPGEDVDIGNGQTVKSGVVVDIVCYKNPKKNSELYYGMSKIPDKYARSYVKYYEDILEAYRSICEELEDIDYGYGKEKIRKSPQLHALIVRAGKIAHEENIRHIKSNEALLNLSKRLKQVKETSTSNLPNKLGLSNRNEPLDTYRIEFTIRYTVTLGKGHKISDQSGGKGVVSEVRPDHLMPYNEYGRADIIMDSNSIISRMNMARPYQQEINGASRYCQLKLREMANGVRDTYQLSDDLVEQMFTYLMGLLGKFNTPQFDYYAQADMNQKREILNVCLNEEVYIMQQVSNPKRLYQIVKDIENSEYAPPRRPVHIPILEDDGKTVKEFITKDPILISPLYTILICKTADNMLYTSSPNLNNFMFPIPVTAANRDRLPYRNTPTKILSETEGRLYLYYGGREAIAELKDRANSVPTHKAMYENILNAPQPSNMEHAVDRTVTPFGEDSAIKLVKAIFKPMGFDYTYIKGQD